MKISDSGKDMEVLNQLKKAMAPIISDMAVSLHEEYMQSDQFLEDQKTQTVIPQSMFQNLAEDRVRNDLKVSTVILYQEGQIPTKNSFYGKEEIVRLAMTLDKDRQLLWDINHGFSMVCFYTKSTPVSLDEVLALDMIMHPRDRSMMS
jgi:hypothetical protein